ncbi:MAG: ribosome biogenesis/translation initiation ATPase RLI [Promethearchaeota archaeon]
MRLAIVKKRYCRSDKCSPLPIKPCMKACPINRTGKQCITVEKREDDALEYAYISESLCTGCGICIKKCSFKAIMIINIPEGLKSETCHRFGQNGFALYRLPSTLAGEIIGLVGENGTGKSTVLNILSGNLKPNLGIFDEQVAWAKIIEHFRGNVLQTYFEKLSRKQLKVSYKPQKITDLPNYAKGTVKSLLKKVDQRNIFNNVVESLGLDKILDRELGVLSGGELQRVAIAGAIMKDCDVYLFDEPSSYLDIEERLKVANLIRSLKEDNKYVIVVEHDLALLDYLSDKISLFYGKPAAYGIVSHLQGVREGINTYLNGFIKDENVRFREEPIRFHEKPPKESEYEISKIYFEYNSMDKQLGNFSLHVNGGVINEGEIIGIVGPNGIGKTTFIKMLAEIEAAKEDDSSSDKITASYKPQYLKVEDETKLVGQLLTELKRKSDLEAQGFNRIKNLLKLDQLEYRKVSELSGGELQRFFIARCLLKKADLYLLDEPSAYLDAEQRLMMAKVLKRVVEIRKKAAFIVEHDIITLDFLADSLIVFEGIPGIQGKAKAPVDLRTGMNLFLKNMDITFRRDLETGRPRVNKKNSKLDLYQKRINEYYYLPKKGEKE